MSDGIPAKTLFETRHLLEEEDADTARIKDRLATFGFTASQIDEIAQTKDLGVSLPVVAPRGGTIVERRAVEGEPATATSSLFTIADLDTMWVHLNVYEVHLPHIRLGQPLTFFPDGLPGKGFEGAVVWISPEVDPQTRHDSGVR